MRSIVTALFYAIVATGTVGCTSPSITAVNLDPKSKEREGIPYYLPKAYLVVTKNVRYIPMPTVGLTQTVAIPDEFQPNELAATVGLTQEGKTNVTRTQSVTQTVTETRTTGDNGNAGGGNGNAGGGNGDAGGGNGNAGGGNDNAPTAEEGDAQSEEGEAAPTGAGSRYGNQVLGPTSIAVVPAVSIPDGLQPETFYTYQWVMLPDLTQKYGLRVKGGAGEMRSTMNLVNGWMYTGTGPYYTRDSTTASSLAAGGAAVGSVVDAVGRVALGAFGIPTAPSIPAAPADPGEGTPQSERVQGLGSIPDYAEVYIYEQVVVKDKDVVGGKAVTFRLVASQRFNRDVLGDVGAGSGAGAGGSPGTGADATNAPPGLLSRIRAAINAAEDLNGAKGKFLGLKIERPRKWTALVQVELTPASKQKILDDIEELEDIVPAAGPTED